MYHVSAQGVDERMVNVHYYYITLPTMYNDLQCYVKYFAKDSIMSYQHVVITLPTTVYNVLQ